MQHFLGLFLMVTALVPVVHSEASSAVVCRVQDWARLEPAGGPGEGLQESSRYGRSVLFDESGDRCWVSAPRAAAPLWRSGLVFAFERRPGTSGNHSPAWESKGALCDPRGEAEDQLGWSLVRSGNHLLAGAPLAGGAQPQAGAVLAWHDQGSGVPQRIWSSQGKTLEGFGSALLATEDGVWVASPYARSPFGPFQAGRIERFSAPVIPGQAWTSVEVLDAPLAMAYARFGEALAWQQQRLLVAAPFESAGGAVYSFGETLLRLTSPLPIPGDEFGASMAVEGEWLAVGAPGQADGSGAIHLFRLVATGWTWEATLTGEEPDGRLGTALAWGDGLLLAGAPNALGGAVLGYRLVGSKWQIALQASRPGTHALGFALADDPQGAGVLTGAPATLITTAPGLGVGGAGAPLHGAVPPEGVPSAWWIPVTSGVPCR